MSTLAHPKTRPADLALGRATATPARRTAGTAGAGAAILGLRVTALGLSFGTAILLARLLGPAGLGVYETAMGWAALLGVPAGLGAEKLVVREVAAAEARGEAGLIRGLARASLLAVLLSASLVAAATGLAVLLLGDRAPAGLALVAAGVVPLAALLRVRQALLQGLAAVVRGQVPELLIAPATFLLLLAASAVLTERLEPSAAIACQAAAFGVALGWASLALRRLAPPALRAQAPRFELRRWRTAAGPLLAIAGLQVLNARVDVVLLGALADPVEVARYAVPNRLAALIGMPLLAANAALGPTIARLHAAGDRAGMQAAVSRAARLSCAAALPIAAGLLLGGGTALGLFGPAFVSATDLLTVLGLAQLANVAMGSVGLILLMTGHARTAALGLGLSACLNLGLDLALIPRLGAMGAAVGAAASLMVWNLVLLLGVRHHLGLRPTVLGGCR
jgi:O-antigen/teichoic acid export membrane protein